MIDDILNGAAPYGVTLFLKLIYQNGYVYVRFQSSNAYGYE